MYKWCINDIKIVYKCILMVYKCIFCSEVNFMGKESITTVKIALFTTLVSMVAISFEYLYNDWTNK